MRKRRKEKKKTNAIINWQNFKIVKLIESGANSETYEVIEKLTNKHYAAKILEAGRKKLMPDEQITQEELINEIKNSRKIKSDFVCSGFLTSDKKPVLIEELMETTLEKILFKRRLNKQELLTFAWQISRAIEDCHKAGFIHGDIKPNNIGYSEGKMKVFDFGTKRGGLLIRAPELFNEKKGISIKGDIYALGVLFFKMATGIYPILLDSEYSEKELPVLFYEKRKQFIEYIKRKIFSEGYYNNIFLYLETNVRNRKFAEVIKRCMQKEASNRFSSVSEISTILKSLLNK